MSLFWQEHKKLWRSRDDPGGSVWFDAVDTGGFRYGPCNV